MCVEDAWLFSQAQQCQPPSVLLPPLSWSPQGEMCPKRATPGPRLGWGLWALGGGFDVRSLMWRLEDQARILTRGARMEPETVTSLWTLPVGHPPTETCWLRAASCGKKLEGKGNNELVLLRAESGRGQRYVIWEADSGALSVLGNATVFNTGRDARIWNARGGRCDQVPAHFFHPVPPSSLPPALWLCFIWPQGLCTRTSLPWDLKIPNTQKITEHDWADKLDTRLWIDINILTLLLQNSLLFIVINPHNITFAFLSILNGAVQ